MPPLFPDDLPEPFLEPPPDQAQQNAAAAATSGGNLGSPGNSISDVVQGGLEIIGEGIVSGGAEVASAGAELVSGVVEGGLSVVGEGVGGCLSGCSLIVLIVLGLAGAVLAANPW